MKKIIGLLIVSTLLYRCSHIDKANDCEPLESYNKNLWLDGTNETLIDNALRCFRLNSIGYPNDSCLRIWGYETYSPDSLGIYYLDMFEFGVKRKRQYATYFNLEWKRGKDKERLVTCVKKQSVQPKSGWQTLGEKMHEMQLNRIDTIPIPLQTDDLVMDGGLTILQYITERNTITVDFSAHTGFLDSKYTQIRKFAELIKLIKDEFSINLVADHFGNDLFKKYSN